MGAIWKFKGQYYGLLEAVALAAGDFKFRQLAAELRGLLLDSPLLADAVNKLFQLSVFFPAVRGIESAAFSVNANGAFLNELLLNGPPDFKSALQAEHLSRDAFLALPAVRLPDASVFSLRDAIIAGANIAGGVHSTPRGADGYRLEPLAAILFGPGRSDGTDLLYAIARHVIDGYRHLFSLAEGASFGMAQPRNEHQPFLRISCFGGQDAAAMEFAGREFFEDGMPNGLSAPLAWIVTLALRLPEINERSPLPLMAERHILDVGPCGDRPGPRFSIIQKGRSIFARFSAADGVVVSTPPVRLVSRRFYAMATGLTETEGQLRVFFHLHRSDPRNVEAFSPPGTLVGPTVPSRTTLGAGLQRVEAKIGQGALMQIREVICLPAASEHDIDLCLQNLDLHCNPRRWISSRHDEMRIPIMYNQAGS